VANQLYGMCFSLPRQEVSQLHPSCARYGSAFAPLCRPTLNPQSRSMAKKSTPLPLLGFIQDVHVFVGHGSQGQEKVGGWMLRCVLLVIAVIVVV